MTDARTAGDRTGRIPRRTSLRLGLAAVAALAVALVIGTVVSGNPATRPHSSALRTGPVTASGTELLLDGQPWWPNGFNAYQLATDWSVHAGCGAQVDLDAYFSALPPRSLTRFSLFAPFTVRADDGTIDYSAVDAVFAAAERHQQLVLPVLSAGDGSCDGDTVKTATWYATGWRTETLSAHGTYLHWVRAAVARWKHSRALAGWTAVGEADPSECPGARSTRACADWRTRTCPKTAATILRTFFDEVGAEIAALDPGRLRFAGLVGAGQCGTAGPDFAAVGASPGIDILEYHDYTLAEPASLAESVPARMITARALNKPLVVAEIGLKGGSCLPLDQRAAAIRTAIAGQRALGTAGALVWSYVPDPRPAQCTFDIGPGDPLWPQPMP